VSSARRLDRLEASMPDPNRAGRRCRDCGGLNIADVMNAYHVLERGRDRGPQRTPTCERCGAGTLHGALAELQAAPDDPE
jgi:hypothetical protein